MQYVQTPVLIILSVNSTGTDEAGKDRVKLTTT